MDIVSWCCREKRLIIYLFIYLVEQSEGKLQQVEFLYLQIHRWLFFQGKGIFLNTEKKHCYFSEANDNYAYL